ncbi:MAG TPA: SUMF1/EgtB/PvdO family nonheme iron enzyme [Gammaproteobacteria bacterium]|nr:SUMF1/EgtB/PvdO family nonheme iron enzyme [Gammaproteobacteria bacterium]
MSIAVNEQLRAVVNEYYHGLVSFEGYRERRGRILDQLGAPAEKPAPEPAPAKTSDATQRPPPSAAAAPTPAAAKPAGEPARPVAASPGLRWVAVGAVGIVVLAGIGFAVLRSSPPEPAGVQAESVPVQQLPPGAALLEQFLQKNAWDQDAVRNLGVGWTNALTEDQRQAAAASQTYARFSDVLVRRLREEQALAGAGETPELARLVGLAVQLKVPYTASLGRTAPAGSPSVPVRAPADDSGRAEPPSASAAVAPPAPDSGPNAPQSGGAAAEPPAAHAEARPSPPPGLPSAPAAVPPAVAAPGTAPRQPPPAAASAEGAAPACSAELLSSRRRPSCGDSLRSGGEGPTLVILPRNTFHMGNDQTRNAGPAHDVTIPAPFAMSVYETSFAEFERYCKGSAQRCPENPWGDSAFPVVLVSWNEAAAYAEWLSAETGQRYRLPSEAEWEYAARAGTQTPYPFGNDVTPSNARSSAISQVTSPIANTDRSVNRNQFQLLHMIGNVREWVADEWHQDYAGAPTDGSARLTPNAPAHAVRGGSYADSALQLRSAARVSLDTGSQDKLTGFRVVRELAP